MMIVNYNDMLMLKSELNKIYPAISDKVKNDINDALQIAGCHITGNWGPHLSSNPIPKERILFAIYNDAIRIDNGEPYVQCITDEEILSSIMFAKVLTDTTVPLLDEYKGSH